MAERGKDAEEDDDADRPLNGSAQASAHEHTPESFDTEAADDNDIEHAEHEDAETSDDAGSGLDNLSVMQGDDALLTALGGLDPSSESSVDDDELNELLLAWRRDIDSEPMAELVDTDTAVTTIKTAAAARRNRGAGRKRRALVPVAVAAAVLAIAFTGTGLAARNAEPGDALWGLTQVLYTDHAQSVQAAASVRTDLETAGTAIHNGKVDKAREALDSAAQALESVAPEDNLSKLRAEHRMLTHKLGEPEDGTSSTSGTSLPGESSSGTSSTSSPDSSASSEPSDSQIPPEQTSPSEGSESSSPTTTTSRPTTSPTASSSDGRGGSGTSPHDGGLPHIETQGAPAS